VISQEARRLRARGAPRASGWSRSPSPFRTWPLRRRALEDRVAGAVGGRSGAISAKYRSKPAGEMISNARAGASPAFQKARGAPLALKTRSPGRTTRTSSPRPGHRPHLRERRSTRPRVRGCEGARRGLEARSGALRARRCPALSTPDHEPCAEPAYHHHLTLVRRQHYPSVLAPRSLHGHPPP
jgi:hypothetical protein